MKIILNVVLFQVGWFACVLGAGKGNIFIGPIAVIFILVIHLTMWRERIHAELKLAGSSLIIGLAFDSMLTATGIHSPVRELIPEPFSELWLLALWVNLAIIINVSLHRLHGKHMLQALLGGIGGPAAYWSGEKLNAISLGEPLWFSLGTLAICWAVATPILFKAANLLNRLVSNSSAQ